MLIIRQAQIIINQFNNLSINQTFQMADPFVNYVISPPEGEINPVYPQDLKLYFQAKKDIEKEADKLDISVSNTEDILYQFISLASKYG